MRIFLALIAWLLCQGGLCAQATLNKTTGLEVPMKVIGPANDWITVTATTEGKTVRWYSADAGLKVFPTELLKDTKTAVVSSQKPGTYRLVAYTAINGEPTVAVTCFVVVGDGGQVPTPEPTPTPTPQPEPKPPIVKAWFVVVEETSESKSNRGVYLTNKALQAFFKEKAWSVSIVDKDVKDASGKTASDLKPLVDRATKPGKTLPQMFLVDQDGHVRLEGAVPDSPDALLNILKGVQ